MVFVLVLAGCGDAPEPDAQAIAEDASAAAEERATLRLEMDALGAQPMRCDGAVDYGRHRVRMKCAGDGDLELITIGRDQYSRGGWVVGSGEDEEPTNRRQKISGAHDEPTDAFPDLREVLRDLRRAAISSERLGREQVRGVDTTRFRVVVDPTKTEFAGGAEEGQTATVDLWIDDDDLLRRLRGREEEGPFDVEFFAFGEPVDIEPPPPPR